PISSTTLPGETKPRSFSDGSSGRLVAAKFGRDSYEEGLNSALPTRPSDQPSSAEAVLATCTLGGAKLNDWVTSTSWPLKTKNGSDFCQAVPSRNATWYVPAGRSREISPIFPAGSGTALKWASATRISVSSL